MGVDKSGSVCLQRSGENLHQEDSHQGKFVSGLVFFFFFFFFLALMALQGISLQKKII